MTGSARVLVGDALETLAGLPDGSVDCVVTSPPYWGLRDYGVEGQLGLEATPDAYAAAMVAVFAEVRRVLAPRGTCWLNLGDSYCNADKWGGGGANTGKHTRKPDGNVASWEAVRRRWAHVDGLKSKDLVGIPWMVAFALRADGWYLRSDIIWSKSNPMPESVTDRPTKSHEYMFLLTKGPRYFFDQEAVRESTAGYERAGGSAPYTADGFVTHGIGSSTLHQMSSVGRNVRSVWEIPTHPYPGAHFATMPPALAERCVLAGCPERVCATCGEPQERVLDSTGAPIELGVESEHLSVCGHDNWRRGVVLDPFLGSGTTAVVALRLGRDAVGVELNQEYANLAESRIAEWWKEPSRVVQPDETQETLFDV